jgi:hypothetical protein
MKEQIYIGLEGPEWSSLDFFEVTGIRVKYGYFKSSSFPGHVYAILIPAGKRGEFLNMVKRCSFEGTIGPREKGLARAMGRDLRRDGLKGF